jgi:hypothetical protein
MVEQLIPLAVLGMIIGAAILGAGYLMWRFSSEVVDARREKRTSKGRRLSDQ